jgi:hypothetical protein
MPTLPHSFTVRKPASTLDPEAEGRTGLLVEIARELAGGGSVFHVLSDMPGQEEDMYEILVDDHWVVSFELPRRPGKVLPEECVVTPFANYRNRIGQGKSRMRLDRAAADAREIIGRDQ